MLTIEQQIWGNVRSNPDKIALVQGDKQITYAQLWDDSLRMAYAFCMSYGVKKGDRILLGAAGSVEFVYAYLGAHIAGAICVPIDPDTNAARFRLIKGATLPKLVAGQLQQISDGVLSLDEIVLPPEKLEYLPPLPKEVADILFTTGTTGTPKGVALSYANLSSAALNINTFIDNTSEDVELLALPVSHSFGLGRLKCVLSRGGTLVMLGTFANVKKFFGEMARCNVTGFGMVPASWGFLKKMSGKYIGKFAEQLRYIEIGSSFMPIEDKQMLMSLLPHTRICMHYGSTEASRSAFMEFHEYSSNLSSAGKASPNCDIKIFSSQGEQLPSGVEGEVCVKGGHVVSSYWNVPKARYEEDFFGEYFRTGDCGVLDDDGNLYLKSRIKEMINVGGKKVSPMEVEDVLNGAPGVVESACVGIADPDAIMGEVVKAFVVTDDSFDEDELRSYVKTRLEVYKQPVFYERIASLPKTASGKLQRLSLKS